MPEQFVFYAPRIWVVAACGGMIAVFENAGGTLRAQTNDAQTFVQLPEQFKHMVDGGERAHAFDQLVVVGSASDIAWVHSSLSEDGARRIAAEIEYPLLPGWFKQPDATALAKAVQGVIA